MIKIRKAAEKDKEQVLQLVKGLYKRKSPKQLKLWKANWNEFRKYTILAITGKKIVAYLAYYELMLPKYKRVPDALYINDLYVLSEYRKKGIASNLIEQAEKVKRKMGLKKIIVDTGKRTWAALKLYKKLGFEPCKGRFQKMRRLIK